MPLRGKILNTWEVESGERARLAGSARHRGRASASIRARTTSTACATARSASSPTPTPTALHIATLLCALFLRHFRPLVAAGHVFVAMPPLFRVDVGKEVFYALDEDEKRLLLDRIEAEKHHAASRSRHALQGPGRDEPAAAARDHHGTRHAPPGAAHRRRRRTRRRPADGHAAGEEARRATAREWLETKGNLADASDMQADAAARSTSRASRSSRSRVFTEKAYLDYSMYVILDRALPHLGDGLKPVQRRIIYAMSELGLVGRRQAQEVGAHGRRRHRQVPSARRLRLLRGHGADGAAVLLPLSDRRRAGQLGLAGRPEVVRGHALHRGAADAATRRCCSSELGQGTVDWQPNFDGTLEEPKLLPARLPNVLLNGATGIAVGMATDIPPHNLREVVGRLRARCSTIPTRRSRELCKHIRGPTSRPAPRSSRRSRARADLQDRQRHAAPARRLRDRGRRDRHHRAAVPGLGRARCSSRSPAQMRAKKLPMVEDLRDESDHENPTRLVITPRSNRVDVEQLMAHLFATTDLERSYRVNINVIGLDGRPRVYGLKELLARVARVPHRDGQAPAAATGSRRSTRGCTSSTACSIAYLNIDEVIRIIRTRGRAEAGADEALQAHRRAGRGDPRDSSCATSPSSRR